MSARAFGNNAAGHSLRDNEPQGQPAHLHSEGTV
jgi:hypothetical protein